jgi:protein CpxP
MLSYTQSAARSLAALALVGSVVLSGPLAMAVGHLTVPASAVQPAPAPELLAEASTSPATTEPAPLTEKSDPVEVRIKDLHGRLHITAAQQTQWDNLVLVMRNNAKAMYDLQKQRGAKAKDMNAIDAVKSYQAVIEAHETGMSKFVPAFQSLYDSMSDSQKHIADAMFRGKVRAASAKKVAKRAG